MDINVLVKTRNSKEKNCPWLPQVKEQDWGWLLQDIEMFLPWYLEETASFSSANI